MLHDGEIFPFTLHETSLTCFASMKASNTLLTHFSARYPNVAPRTQEKAHGTLALASDSMRLRIGDMWKMPIYAPAIEQALMTTFGTEDEDASMAIAASN
jgi:ribonuclease Z